jgi:hypothetical protein
MQKIHRASKGQYRALAITLTFKDLDHYVAFDKKGSIKWAMNIISDYIKRKFGRRDFFYNWVLELQKRGVPHYHILVLVPKEVWLPYLDEWFFKDFGFSNIKELKNFGANYLVKYLYNKGEKSYQQKYEWFRAFMRAKYGKKNIRVFGYCFKVLNEVLRFVFNKVNYIKWYARRVLNEKIESVFEITKHYVEFYYYVFRGEIIYDLLDYFCENFEHIRRLEYSKKGGVA